MQIGELAELICAPDYGTAHLECICGEMDTDDHVGYGASGSPPTIPPNSVLKFEVELFGFEEAADTDEKRLAFAVAQKEEGNKAFAEKQNDAAAAAYEKVASLLARTNHKRLTEHLQALSYLSKMTGSSEEAQTLTKACHLNAAQAYLHLKEANKAMQHLKATQDDQSLKYNYRLAQTYTLMQDWSAAEAAFKRAKEVADEKMKVVIQREMVQLQQKKKLEAQKNRQTWGKLFA